MLKFLLQSNGVLGNISVKEGETVNVGFFIRNCKWFIKKKNIKEVNNYSPPKKKKKKEPKIFEEEKILKKKIKKKKKRRTKLKIREENL
jgi:hypothetical protein